MANPGHPELKRMYRNVSEEHQQLAIYIFSKQLYFYWHWGLGFAICVLTGISACIYLCLYVLSFKRNLKPDYLPGRRGYGFGNDQCINPLFPA